MLFHRICPLNYNFEKLIDEFMTYAQQTKNCLIAILIGVLFYFLII